MNHTNGNKTFLDNLSLKAFRVGQRVMEVVERSSNPVYSLASAHLATSLREALLDLEPGTPVCFQPSVGRLNSLLNSLPPRGAASSHFYDFLKKDNLTFTQLLLPLCACPTEWNTIAGSQTHTTYQFYVLHKIRETQLHIYSQSWTSRKLGCCWSLRLLRCGSGCCPAVSFQVDFSKMFMGPFQHWMTNPIVHRFDTMEWRHLTPNSFNCKSRCSILFTILNAGFTIILSVSETSWLFSLCSVPTVVCDRQVLCMFNRVTPAIVQSDAESNTNEMFLHSINKNAVD